MFDVIAGWAQQGGQWWGQLEEWLLALASSVWSLPALFVSTAADGFFPPVPGETLLIMLAVAAQTGDGVPLAVVLAVAALGAWTGDQVAFWLGRAVGTGRVPFLRGPRGRRAVDWASRALHRRGAAVVLSARFVPVGRMAVNVTAGAVGFPRRRFAALSAVASVLWAAYYVLIAVLAGRWLGDRPLLAVVVGIATGTLLGLVVDRVVRAREGRADARLRERAEGARGADLAPGDARRAGTSRVVPALVERPRPPAPCPERG